MGFEQRIRRRFFVEAVQNFWDFRQRPRLVFAGLSNSSAIVAPSFVRLFRRDPALSAVLVTKTGSPYDSGCFQTPACAKPKTGVGFTTGRTEPP